MDEEPFPLDADGFVDLAGEPDANAPLLPGALVTPGRAAMEGALVLLGEPGVGKTTSLGRVVAAHVAEDLFRIDGADLDDAESVRLFLADAFAASRAGRSPLVIIDQADESPMIRRLAGGSPPGGSRLLAVVPREKPERILRDRRHGYVVRGRGGQDAGDARRIADATLAGGIGAYP